LLTDKGAFRLRHQPEAVEAAAPRVQAQAQGDSLADQDMGASISAVADATASRPAEWAQGGVPAVN